MFKFVQIKFKEGLVYKFLTTRVIANPKVAALLKRAGIKSVAELADRLDMSYPVVCSILAMRTSPHTRSGELIWRNDVLRLCKILGVSNPWDLFPVSYAKKLLSKVEVENQTKIQRWEIPVQEIGEDYGIYEDLTTPLIKQAAIDYIFKIPSLTPQEVSVLTLRYQGGTPLSFRKIGEKLGVTISRIREVEYKALRKIRWHSHHKTTLLKSAYES
jgi:DNA-binding CsgD family transcriptional regulator